MSIQGLVRTNLERDDKPRYHTMDWNCHDVGIRLAYLATSGNGPLEIILKLLRSLKSNKDLTRAVSYGAIFVPVAIFVPGIVPWITPTHTVYGAVRNAIRWMEKDWNVVLEERFSQLRHMLEMLN